VFGFGGDAITASAASRPVSRGTAREPSAAAGAAANWPSPRTTCRVNSSRLFGFSAITSPRGGNPAEALRAPSTSQRRSLRKWAEAYRTSRVDLSANAHKAIGSHLPRILAAFGDREPETITVADVQEWVAANGDLKPASLSRYLASLRLLLDFAGTEPNPARDRRVRLPRIEQAVVEPPTAEQVEAILDRVGERWCLPLRTLEQSGMRVGELSQLEWRDVDVAGSRFPGSATARRRRPAAGWPCLRG
jgi:integrase